MFDLRAESINFQTAGKAGWYVLVNQALGVSCASPLFQHVDHIRPYRDGMDQAGNISAMFVSRFTSVCEWADPA